MASTISPSIDNLDRTWASLIELCEGLTEDQWKLPTGCPGWSVQDQVAHLIDYESRALGRPAPEGTALERPHTKNPLGQSNEVGVEHRRGWKPAEVLDELKEVVAARSAQLHALTADDLTREVTTPAGPGTLTDMLRLRVMDTWSHEQDIRRAVGRPGHENGPVVAEAVAHLVNFVPFVVGKRAAAPDGSVVVFEIEGGPTVTIEVVDGRAKALEAAGDATDATVRLAMPATTFVALVGGRSDAPEDVTYEGDTDLGRRIVEHLGFMP
jgi:uncharacterized protein (TIGR03083 family)